MGSQGSPQASPQTFSCPARRDTDLGVRSWDLGLPPASSVALGQVTLAPSCCLPHRRLGRDVMGPERTWPGPRVETSRGTLPSPNSSLISGVMPTRTKIRGRGVGVEWWLASQCLNKGSPTSNEAHWHRFTETDTTTWRGGSLPEFTGQMVETSRRGPWSPGFRVRSTGALRLPTLMIDTVQRRLIHSPQTCPFRPVPSYGFSVPRRSGQLLT